MMVLAVLPPHLCVLDATHHVPDGLTGIMGDPTPSHPGRLYAAIDPLALDLVAARHMHLRSFPQGGSLSTAIDWFDDPTGRVQVDGVDTRIEPFSSPLRNDLTVLLSAMSYPVYRIGHRGSLWQPVMDPAAFPLKVQPTLLERLIRPTLRALFGYGAPGKAT